MPWKTDVSAVQEQETVKTAESTPQPTMSPTSPPKLQDDTPIEEVVQAARVIMKKPGRPSDKDLVTWLEEQEVSTYADLCGLSADSFMDVKKAPGCTLVLFDALSKLKNKELPTGTEKAKSGTEPATPKKMYSALSLTPASAAPRNLTASASEGVRTQSSGGQGARNSGILSPRGSVRITEDMLKDKYGTLATADFRDHLGIITMTNDSKRNCLSEAALWELSSALYECFRRKVRCVIIRANPGAKVWSSGKDIRELKNNLEDPLSRNDPFVRFITQFKAYNTPIIAAIEGTVWGAATDLAACCDIVVCAPETTFAITPVKIGLPYNNTGLSHFAQVMPLHIVKWMFFSGSILPAEQAKSIGFVNEIVPAAEVGAKAEEMAQTIALRAPLVVRVLKKQLEVFSRNVELNPDEFEDLHEARQRCYRSEDMQEGIRAFYEKREPAFQGK